MTVIIVEALERALGLPGPIVAGEHLITYWAGHRPFSEVVGGEVIFPAPISVRIVDGAAVESVDLEPTRGVCCVKWVVRSYAGGEVTRYVAIPNVGPVAFGDLVDVDRMSFEPVDPTPSLVETINGAIESAPVIAGIAGGLADATGAIEGRLSEESIAHTIVSAVDVAAPVAVVAEGSKRFTGKTTLTPGRSGEVVAPQFAKVGGALVTHNATGMPSILGMAVLCTDGVVDAPLGRYYAYISTDHDSAGTPEPFNGKGGICLAYADEPLGPWTVYKANGEPVIFQDRVDGDQTENPAPLAYTADPAGKGVYLYYGQQGAGMNQSTGLARSATGLPDDFERVGLAIVGRATWPGDGQRTYFQPLLRDGKVVGRHLIGGGDWAQIGFSYSYDGQEFVTDPRRLGHYSHLVGADNGRRLNLGSVFYWRGEPWAIATIGNHTSGFLTAPRQGCVVRLSRDLRRVIGQPVFFPDGVTGGFPIEHDGKVYVFYRAGNAYSETRAMVSEA